MLMVKQALKAADLLDCGCLWLESCPHIINEYIGVVDARTGGEYGVQEMNMCSQGNYNI